MALPAPPADHAAQGTDGAEQIGPNPLLTERDRPTVGLILHRARVFAFYGLSGLLTLFLTFELFAHLLLPTPVVTDWAHGHHIHALAHFVLTAVLIPAVGCGLYPRVRRIAGLQSLLLVNALGLAASVIAWLGFHDFDFPVFNFTLYGTIAILLGTLHPERRRLFTGGRIEPKLALMAGLAFVPLVAYASSQAAKQIANAEPVHAIVGHFALTAALAVALLGLAVLSAIRTDGWHLPLWSSGLAMVALGIGSAALPSEASSLGVVGGVAAIAWGGTFIWLGNRRPAQAGEAFA